MLIIVDGVTDLGRARERNEDALLVGTFVTGARHGAVTVQIEVERGLLVVAVIDGMGGHAAGDRASRLAAHHLADAAPGLTDAAAIGDAVVAAHRRILEEAQLVPGTEGMGATIAGLAIEPDGRAIAFNVGDSRVYMLVEGCLVQVSTDDSPPRPPGMPSDAHIVAVTQALGAGRTSDPLPHLQDVRLEPGSRLLVCSDGLTDYASLDEIEDEVAGLAPRAADLCRLALDGGGGDNVTVALVNAR